MPYINYLVVSRNSNKIWQGNGDSGANWHRFSYTSGSFTEEQSSYINFLPFVSMIHSFSDNKHFIIYSDFNSFETFWGISADSNALSQDKFANASYFDTASKPNSVGGTQYYSLNEAFTNLETVVLLNGNYSSTNDCTGEKLFVFIGSVKNCVSNCPSGKEYTEQVQSNWLCRTACYTGNSWMHDTRQCVIGTCSTAGLREYGPVANKECSNQCENAYRYLNGNNCLEDCPNFMSPTENILSDTLEKGECVAACNNPKFRFSDPTIQYPSTAPRIYCLDDCTLEGRIYYETSGEARTCVSKCQSNHFLDLRTFTSGFSISVLEASDPQKECLSVCTEYKFFSNFEFADFSSKNYCLGGCPDNYYSNEQNPGDNVCIVDCSLAPLNKYATPDKKCTSSCSNTIYHFSREDTKECLDSCLSSSTHKYTTPDDTCVPSCSATINNYFVNELNTLFCVSSCTNTDNVFREVGLEKECVSSCNGDFIQLLSDPSPLTESSIASGNLPGECVSSCSGFVLETSVMYASVAENKIFCLSACPEDMFILIDSGTSKCVNNCEYPLVYHTPYRECTDNCSNAGYRFDMEDLSCSDECSGVIDLNTSCLSSCPLERPLIENNHCTDACSSLKPFVLDFYECVDKCPSKAFDNVCVYDCSDEKIIKFYSDQAKVLIPRPFTLSTNTCSESCTESSFKYALEHTLECVSKCPETGMKYSDNDKICRTDCFDPNFPFKDEETKQCLSECLPERPMVLLESNECVDKCPPSSPFLFNRPNCGGDSMCDSYCPSVIVECRPNCPLKAKFKLERAETFYCFCSCPLFYLPDTESVCKLNCDNSIGLVEADSKETCLHCRDNLDKALFEGECVSECPKGYIQDNNGVCRSCFELDLWQDDSRRCLKFEQCDPLSHFFYPTKLCSVCNQPGFKILVEQGKHSICTKTQCSEGHIKIESGIIFCYVCLPDYLFHEDTCKTSCPIETNYSFQKFSCIPSCFPECTASCCVNGKCKGNKCECRAGFTGDRCDLEVSDSIRIEKYSKQFLIGRLKTRLLTLNESYVLDDISSLEGYSGKRILSNNSTPDFIERIISLVEIKHVKYSYSTKTFTILDRLLGLALNLPFSTKKQDVIQSILSRIDKFSTDIQEFNTSIKAEADFEQAFRGKFEGRYFSFSFGPGTNDVSEINIDNCLKKIRTSLNKHSAAQFPYALLKFSAFASNNIKRNSVKGFTLSISPLMELYIYTSFGILDLNSVCPKFYADFIFAAPLTSKEIITAQTLKQQNFDVFDKNDSLFVDKCVKFGSDSADLTLKERKEAYFIDPKEVCDERFYNICNVKLVNEEYKCSCKGIQDKKKSTLEKIAGTYPETNFNLIYCYSAFIESNLASNPTFYVLLPIILVSWLLSCLFVTFKDKALVNRDFNELIRQAVALYDPNRMNETVFFTECLEIAQNLKKFRPRTARNGKPVFKNAHKYLPTIPDLDALPFEQLVKFDTRSSFQFAFDTLTEEHSVFNTLFKQRVPGSPMFPIMMFFTEIVLNIGLNAFFVEDSMIQRKNEQGEPSIWTAFSTDILTRVWIVATTKLVISTLSVLTPANDEEEKAIIKVILRDQSTATIKCSNRHRADQRTRMILFMLFCAGVQAVCVYFLVIFNEIYENSTNVWITGVLATLLLEWTIIETLVPIALISTRIISKHFESTIGGYRWAFKLKKLPRLKDALEF